MEAKEHEEAGKKGKEKKRKMFGLERPPKYRCLLQILPEQGKRIH